MQTQIAICIVSYQRAQLTERCIDSIRLTTSLPYRIFLVDNGSPDTATKTLLDRLESDRDIELYRLERNFGPSTARNKVLARLSESFNYVAMLDNDIIALPGWDRAAVRALESSADLIQPKLLDADGHTLERGPNRPNPSPLAANPAFIGRGLQANDPVVNQEEEAVIVGTAAIVRREVIEKIGLFDERLHIAEDFDLSFRARAAGFRLRYVPDCALIHDHGFDYAYDQERGQTEKYLVSHVLFWRRWQKALLSPAYLAWFGWLHRHNEPMYLPPDQRWRIAHRRLRRRMVKKWCMTRHANVWDTAEAADQASESLGRYLGL